MLDSQIDEPSTFGGLSPEDRDRLTQLLDDYLISLERGEPVSAEQLATQHPDLADILKVYLRNLHDLYGLAANVAEETDLASSSTSPTGSPHRGMRLDDYELLRELGRGGMGIVYEAQQTSLSRRVAIKLLPMAGLLDPKRIARFQNESHTAGQLSHPHIVPVYSVGVDHGVYYYVMPLIDGQALDQWIASEQSNPSSPDWQAILRWIIDAADALHETHQCGVLHRDIKPSNLMIDQDSKVWVMDFGLARCQNELSLTVSGDLVGTMRYMSPEQSLGRAELVDHRTDIYSLAATLYELLTLQPAVRGEDAASLLRFIEREEPTPLHKLTPELPVDLAVVVHKALSKIRDDRYGTMREFADDLSQILIGGPIAARPMSLSSRMGRWVVRNQFAVAISLILLTVAASGFAASTLLIAAKNRIATDNANKANFFVQQAHTAVDQFGAQVAEELAGVPGAEAARLAVLKETLRYYENFVAQARNNSMLQADLAKTYSRIGSLTQELLGSAKALPHYEQSDRIYRELVEADSDNVAYASSQAENLNHLGLACLELGDYATAEEKFRAAIAMQSTLSENFPEDITFQIDCLLTQNNLGLMFRQRGDDEQARKILAPAVEQLQQEHAVNPESILIRRGLSAALVNLSSTRLASAPAKSIELLHQAIDLQLVGTDSSRDKIRSGYELANSYNNLGVAYRKLNQFPSAVDAFEYAIALQRQLISIAPEVLTYTLDLAATLNNLAAAQQGNGNARGAEAAAGEAVKHQRTAIDQSSSRADILSRLATMESNWGLALATLDLDGALPNDIWQEKLISAIQHQRQAMQWSRDDPAYVNLLSDHYDATLQCLIRREQWSELGELSEKMVQDTHNSANGRKRSVESLAHLVTLMGQESLDLPVLTRLKELQARLQKSLAPSPE